MHLNVVSILLVVGFVIFCLGLTFYPKRKFWFKSLFALGLLVVFGSIAWGAYLCATLPIPSEAFLYLP